MSEGNDSRGGGRRLHPKHLRDPRFRNHRDYIGPRDSESPSISPSENPNEPSPGNFEEQHAEWEFAKAMSPSPPHGDPPPAHERSPTSKGKAAGPKDETANPKGKAASSKSKTTSSKGKTASSKSKTTSSKGKTASSKDQPTNPHPTEPQSSQALTVTGPQERQVVKWSSTVRPGPYDAANMPQDGEKYNEEEKWRIAWGYADGLDVKDLWKCVPNRKRSSGPGEQWRRHLAKMEEFAWVQPLRDADLKKVVDEILINRRQEEAKQQAAKEKTNADNAEKKRKSDAGGKEGKKKK